MSACSLPDSIKANADFGADADYFIGLRKLEENKENEARSKFLRCIKKGSSYCAKKSAQILTTFGSIQQKNTAALNLAKNFSDEESLLTALRCLYDSNEIKKVISLTDNLDITKVDNSILKIRFEAIKKRGDTSLSDEMFLWFTSRPLSAQHSQFFYNHEEAFSDETDARNKIIRFRIKVYERNYIAASKLSQIIIDKLNSIQEPLLPLLASDLGKTKLYAEEDFLTNAQIFEAYAKTYEGTSLEFYLSFYAARLYEKISYFQKAKSFYKKAIDASLEASQKDNALWYFLELQRKLSLQDLVILLKDYAPLISEPEYFDDHFDSLLSVLLHSTNKNLILDTYRNIKGYASEESCAKYSYVFARLLMDGIVSVPSSNTSENTDKDALIKKLLEESLDCGSSLYYKILAAYRLSYSDSELENILYKKTYPHNNNSDLEKLLRGYAHFGFPEKIYNEILAVSKDEISTDTAFFLADFLSKCSSQNQSYGVQSLRIASRAATCIERPLTLEEKKLIYPKYFSGSIDTFSQKYAINSSNVYALVRSESFFDSQIVSHAGAVGLSQLMPLTAQDVARKLKKSDYFLNNPEDNLEFGTYYLSELYNRCDKSMLLAFFSYNAGITRVRRWLKSSLAEFGRKGDLSGDLFLETLPYEETREYGRKLISASAIYELLYSENDYNSYKVMIDELVY
ncbi:MAG: lytic transglycosylase domain-containing protein [Treponema sp.]|nr:lytic transglycosylase domain-containing protein [Treponema sp.]